MQYQEVNGKELTELLLAHVLRVQLAAGRISGCTERKHYLKW